jgi:hypothetical protein
MRANNNLRVHNTHSLGLPPPILRCPAPGCNRSFYNRSGRTNHMRSQHPEFIQSTHIENDYSSSSSGGRSTPDPIYEHSLSPTALGDGNSAEASPYDVDMDVDLPQNSIPDDDTDDDSTSPSSNIPPSYAGFDDHVQHYVAPLGINTSYHPIINGAF